MVGILLMSIGIIFIVIGIKIFLGRIKLFKYIVQAEGEIIDFKKCVSSYIDENKQKVYIKIYKPVIRFIDENNEIRIITYNVSRKHKNYKIGDKIVFAYTRYNNEYMGFSEKQIDFSVLCKLISLGIMFIIFAVILWII